MASDRAQRRAAQASGGGHKTLEHVLGWTMLTLAAGGSVLTYVGFPLGCTSWENFIATEPVCGQTAAAIPPIIPIAALGGGGLLLATR